MRSIILAAAFVAAAEAAVFAEPSNEPRAQGRFPMIVQGLEGAVGIQPKAADEPRFGVSDHGAVPVSFSASGKPFTCAQIRVMDEVELITDDSYCN
jgi:hypothetical protein